MRNLLQLLFSKKNNPPDQSTHSAPVLHGGLAPPSDRERDMLRYPPFDRGFPAISTANVIEGQEDIIERIKRTVGLPLDEFDLRIMPLLSNLAEYLHLLPATSTSYFRGEGGLLRMSLEIGLYSLQAANASIFPVSGGVERRHLIYPKWCVGTLVAALCSQLYRVVSQMVVVTADNRQWPALTIPLSRWIKEEGADVYFVRWTDAPGAAPSGQAAGAFLVSFVAPPDQLQWVGQGNHNVLPAMAAAIAAVDPSHRDNPISRIICPIISRVIDDDVKRMPINYGQLTVGAHLEPHVIDAMRRMVRDGTWAPNRPAGILWIGTDGVYLRWAKAAQDIAAFLGRDGFGGVPQDPDVLAEILLRAGVAERRSSQQPYWEILLPDSGEFCEGALKLSHAGVLFSSETTPEPLAVQIARSSSAAKGAATTPVDDSQFALDLGDAKPEVAPAAKAVKKRKSAPSAPEPDLLSTPPTPVTEIALPDNATPIDRAPAPEVQVVNAEPVADGILQHLSKPHAWLMGEIVAAYQGSRLTGQAQSLPHGFAISQQELESHGQQVTPFIQELAQKKWLWIDTTKPGRHMHQVEFDGGVGARALVLRPDIARSLGLLGGK